ncbi:MAG: formate--tetrahydrofolate ligase [Treponema sp.]|nr:formate--tetrahydrofolate ligase [Spirochaetia bacterium]MDD7459338.1 formate--tetrahydrofolate ligase [Spirochaetales bacterium]MDY5812880.1 formate--tetrahydrofolate ligase [Treponema sp.]MEE1181620.1 formate--tetrahydrofolate ligase [Treponema sp.]
MTDIEIAQKNVMVPVTEVAAKIGLTEKDLDLYGSYKAKINFEKLNSLQASGKKGKLILVTAMTPTAAGEGKSTVTIALGDGLNKIGKKTVIALREPSLGPCFGIKGGACGGGYAQVVPMEDINLHFTGDIHAITAANNLMAALIDNHLQQGNSLNIDPRTITWKRCVDLNDRALRNVIIGLGSRIDGVPRESHFQISVASEIMAIVCLSKSISELKEKISKITIGQTYTKENVSFGQLKCTGAVAALLKDAIRPNLVQTLEKNPAFIHGGPFANIAHGCNSINATLCALATGDYVVTEAGFAADLGAEKFFDIKCRMHGLKPNAVVIVATCRAIKMHGGVLKADLGKENLEAIKAGFENVKAHIANIKKFGLPCVVAVNKFITDTDAEVALVQQLAKECGSEAILCEGWGKGGEGAKALAEKVAELCDKPSDFKNIYDLNMPFKAKIETLAKEIYGASSVEFDPKALKKLAEYEKAGYTNLPVCMAKTQNSISHDKAKLGAPKGYVFPVRDVQLYSGAGFVVAFAGDIVDMPGLPKVPAAENIDVDDNGVISGLF